MGGFTPEQVEDLRRVLREELAATSGTWLTARQAADYLTITVPALHNLVSTGRLPRHGEKGHAIRLRRADLDAYLETRGRRS